MHENDIIFFQPLWRRILVCVFCLIWSAIEWTSAEPFWGVMTGALAVYCYWRFIHNFKENTLVDK